MAQNMALDLMLRTLMGSAEFRDAQNKNWDAVARLIPGSTSQQCAKRWKEIQQTFSVASTIYSKSHSSAGAKNLSQFLNSFLHSAEEKEVSVTGVQVVKAELQPEVNSSEEQLTLDPGPDRASKNVSYQDSADFKQRSALRQVSRSARSQTSTGESSQGPNMVIHVCDESKNLKQDFTCPRDLLISEMRYFAEYLSVEAQHWEEVDISVHCDVQIFDWLMRYVKRKLQDRNKSTSNEKRPKLEPNNVISILISSDFLKMDSLVGECIQFCHENMSTIIATPCNMNCINDKLVTRIALLFNHNELDDIRDRKDKFKSKLFCKKIEELFDPRTASSRCPSNASTLFRCVACGKLLTAKSQSKLRCVPNRMMVNHRGKVSYVHTRDFTWDVNEYLLGLRDELKSWKDVYWRLWGAINILYCYRCGNCFPCSELGHCSYHPMVVDYGKQDCSATKVVGVYPCCQQRVLHFDPSSEDSGCCVRDHRTTLVTSHSAAGESRSNTKDSTCESTAEKSSEGLSYKGDKLEEKTASEETGNISKEGRTQVSDSVADEKQQTNGAAVEPPSPSPKRNSVLHGSTNIVNNPVVIEDLFAHRTSICVPFRRLTSARWAELNVFGVEELALTSMRARETEQSGASALSDMIDPSERKPTEYPTYLPSIRRSRSRLMHRTSVRRMKLQTGASKEDDYDLGEDEDQPESEDNDIDFRGPSRERPRPPRKVTSASRKDFSTFKSYKWDTQRSARWNQDAQREEDQKRMTELVSYLTRKRSHTPQEKSENKQKAKEFAGGIFSKLEYQFKMSQQPPTSKTQSGAPQTGSSQRIRKIPLKVTT